MRAKLLPFFENRKLCDTYFLVVADKISAESPFHEKQCEKTEQ